MFGRILNSDVRNLKVNEIKSTPYILYTLEAVLWCFLCQENFKDSVLTGVNLGGDTDTIGALIGGLSGIIYDVPVEWGESLVKKDQLFEKVKIFMEGVRVSND